MSFTLTFLNYKQLKLKLRVCLTGCIFAMVTYYAMKMTYYAMKVTYYAMKVTTTCPLMIGHLCNANIVTPLDKELCIDPSKFNCRKVLETVTSHLKLTLLVYHILLTHPSTGKLARNKEKTFRRNMHLYSIN